MSSSFQKRRQQLLSKIDSRDAVLVLSPSESIRNSDTHYPYRTASDFFYLTGFTEPNAALLLRPNSDNPFILFVRPRNRAMETWDGRRAGVEGAKRDFSADEAFPFNDLNEKLPSLLEGRECLHYQFGVNSEQDRIVLRSIAASRKKEKRGLGGPVALRDLSGSLHEMRLFKDDEEKELLRKAALISIDAHQAAMRQAAPGVNEYQLAATLEHVFRYNGASGPGYNSIVGSGINATILHYVENSCVLRDNELVLIDAGGEYQHYSADITRTFPVNGRFSPVQKDLYDRVLNAQLKALEAAKKHESLDQIHDVTVRALTEHLVEMKILTGSVEEAIEKQSYRKYYMHGTSHWLGMDVHDVGKYRKNGTSRQLEPDMVFTIEPGLYFAEDDDSIPDNFRGIGIRIEDDVLVTENGIENLTSSLGKTVEELEALCQN